MKRSYFANLIRISIAELKIPPTPVDKSMAVSQSNVDFSISFIAGCMKRKTLENEQITINA